MAPKSLKFSNRLDISRLLITTFFLTTLHFQVFGQWSADFSEKTLSEWSGDTIDFIVNDEQRLQLNAPEGKSKSIISRKIEFGDTFSLALDLRLDFDPSASNNLEVFFATDTLNQEGIGYGISIGQNGNQDAIDFIRADNISRTILISGPAGMVASGPVIQSIIIAYSGQGNWKCFADGGNTFIGEITDTTISAQSLQWLRIICKYSASRRDKFQFDNIHAGEIPSDTTGPLLTLSIADHEHLKIYSDEPLDTIWLRSLSAFPIIPSGNASIAKITAVDSFILKTSFSIAEGTEYTILLDPIKDLAGNHTSSTSLNFIVHSTITPELNDVIMSEIMFDPSPPVWLPEFEYVEIYNRSNKVLQLEGWKFIAGNSTRTLPDFTLDPHQFALLCDNKDVELFPDSILKIGISSFPSLSNQGSQLQLLSANDKQIHVLAYSVGMHTDQNRKNGGYSIELTQPNALCDPFKSWVTTNSMTGGTPGFINSEWHENYDTTGPVVLRIAAISPHNVLLEFDEKINPDKMLNPDSYIIQPVLTVDTAFLTSDRIITLETLEEIEQGVTYSFNPFNAWDCMNNTSIIDSNIYFSIAQSAYRGDIVINELLSDPKAGGSRFIEVYNVTDHPIVIHTIGFLKGSIQEPINLCQIQTIIEPKEFAVFSDDKRNIESEFHPPYSDRIIECDLPSFNNQSDFIGLFIDGILVDSVRYSADWHHPLLKETKGFSLERIDPSAPASLSSSWKSCTDPLQGTPGRKNSSAIPLSNGMGTIPWLEKNAFSPDQDGHDDLLIIHLPEKLHHFIVNAWMLDTDGREIIQWANNEFVSGRRSLVWDGLDKNGQIARMGIYIAYLQFWSSDGDVHTFRLPCALVTR